MLLISLAVLLQRHNAVEQFILFALQNRGNVISIVRLEQKLTISHRNRTVLFAERQIHRIRNANNTRLRVFGLQYAPDEGGESFLLPAEAIHLVNHDDAVRHSLLRDFLEKTLYQVCQVLVINLMALVPALRKFAEEFLVQALVKLDAKGAHIGESHGVEEQWLEASTRLLHQFHDIVERAGLAGARVAAQVHEAGGTGRQVVGEEVADLLVLLIAIENFHLLRRALGAEVGLVRAVEFVEHGLQCLCQLVAQNLSILVFRLLWLKLNNLFAFANLRRCLTLNGLDGWKLERHLNFLDRGLELF